MISQLWKREAQFFCSVLSMIVEGLGIGVSIRPATVGKSENLSKRPGYLCVPETLILEFLRPSSANLRSCVGCMRTTDLRSEDICTHDFIVQAAWGHTVTNIFQG